MSTVIIACTVLKQELNQVIEETGSTYPVHWVDTEETHVWPDKLRIQLQEVFDGLQGVDRVLLAFGYCGNALLGLHTRDFQLVFPKVDDCISLLLGSCQRRKEVAEEAHSYFMTKGWVDSPLNLWASYQKERPRLIARWGEERAERLLKATLIPDNYKRIVLVDTGAFKLEEVQPQTELIARELRLNHDVVGGTTNYLRDLLQGPWDQGFVSIEPGKTVMFEHVVGEPIRN